MSSISFNDQQRQYDRECRRLRHECNSSKMQENEAAKFHDIQKPSSPFWPPKIRYHKTFSEAMEPTRQTEASVGLDLYAPDYKNKEWTIPPGERHLIDTGIVLEMPVDETNGFQVAAIIKDKSSLAYKDGLCVKAGVVDPDFRGSVKVVLRNESVRPVRVQGGQKIAQILFIPTWCPRELIYTPKETVTERGTREFGGMVVKPQEPKLCQV